jgi:fatty acid elongase 3
MDSFHFVSGETFASTWHYPAAGVAIYLATLFVLSRVLSEPIASKSAFKPIEVVHNLVLIGLSTTMMIGTLVGAHERYVAEGLVNGLLCTKRTSDTIWDGKLGYFTYIFYLSKFYELLDTVLLSLRKKKIISLQVWHHSTMLFVTWSWFAFPWLEGAWWCTLGKCDHGPW